MKQIHFVTIDGIYILVKDLEKLNVMLLKL